MPKKLFGWLDFGSNIFGTVANVVSTALTNKSNQRIEAARNAMQIAENEKAYQRSKPTNQVAQMQAAGMSKAGALNAINGGATYTPASMSSTPNQAPQVDLSQAFDGLIQIGENAKQRKLQEESLDKQLKAASEAQQAQFEENAKQREHEILLKDIDSLNQTQHDYIEYQKHVERLNLDSKDLQLRRDSFEYGKKLVDAQTELTNVQRDKINAELEEWKKEPFVSARENKARLEKLAAIYNYHVSKADFFKYLQDYYTYDEELDSYVPMYDPKRNSLVGSFEAGEKIVKSFWDVILSVVPIKSILGFINLFGK